MYKMWPNKNNTYQLKIPTKQLKTKSAITSHTKPNTSYFLTVSKQPTSATLIKFVDLQLHLHQWIRHKHSSQIFTGNSWRRRFCGVGSARRGKWNSTMVVRRGERGVKMGGRCLSILHFSSASALFLSSTKRGKFHNVIPCCLSLYTITPPPLPLPHSPSILIFTQWN